MRTPWRRHEAQQSPCAASAEGPGVHRCQRTPQSEAQSASNKLTFLMITCTLPVQLAIPANPAANRCRQLNEANSSIQDPQSGAHQNRRHLQLPEGQTVVVVVQDVVQHFPLPTLDVDFQQLNPLNSQLFCTAPPSCSGWSSLDVSDELRQVKSNLLLLCRACRARPETATNLGAAKSRWGKGAHPLSKAVF